MSTVNNGKKWTEKSIKFLRYKVEDGWKIKSIAGVLHRSPDAVRRMISRLYPTNPMANK